MSPPRGRRSPPGAVSSRRPAPGGPRTGRHGRVPSGLRLRGRPPLRPRSHHRRRGRGGRRGGVRARTGRPPVVEPAEPAAPSRGMGTGRDRAARVRPEPWGARPAGAGRRSGGFDSAPLAAPAPRVRRDVAPPAGAGPSYAGAPVCLTSALPVGGARVDQCAAERGARVSVRGYGLMPTTDHMETSAARSPSTVSRWVCSSGRHRCGGTMPGSTSSNPSKKRRISSRLLDCAAIPPCR